MDPFLLSPVLMERPWGGRRLSRYGKHLPDEKWIGESWEVADLPGGVAGRPGGARTRVASGPEAGATLAELIAAHRSQLMGAVDPTQEGDFPLLVKLLDARENLSVQVHPDSAYARTHPEVRLKTESWYVLESEPGAELFLGFVDGVTPDEVGFALGTPAIVDLLRRVPAAVGDFHHLPAGLVHSLGAGVMVAEVQTPSDTTFRIYDWAEEYGREPRPLHTEEARETISIADPPPPSRLSPGAGPGTRSLVETPYYWMVEHRSSGRVVLGGRAGVEVCMVVRGGSSFSGLDAPLGSTVVIPASAGRLEVHCQPGSILLEVGLASIE